MYACSCLSGYTFICVIVLFNNERFNWILYSTNETEMRSHALAKQFEKKKGGGGGGGGGGVLI